VSQCVGVCPPIAAFDCAACVPADLARLDRVCIPPEDPRTTRGRGAGEGEREGAREKEEEQRKRNIVKERREVSTTTTSPTYERERLRRR